MHLLAAEEVAEILDTPPHVTQGGLIPIAYFTGTDFKPGVRKPASDVTFWNTWGDIQTAADAQS